MAVSGRSVTVAIDAMGGDHGPDVIVGAVLDCLAADPHLHISLCGHEAQLRAVVAEVAGGDRPRLSFTDAADVIPHDMPPASALRHGGASSLAVALRAVRGGEADAAVSAGNTGALLALARYLIGTLPGIERPALMSRLPTVNGSVWVLDLGANIGVDARRLFEFAMLGSAAVTALNGGRKPRVGLLNVGVEASKGQDVVREAARLIESTNALNYIGFVEGDHVFQGRADVVVCDGFVGNVLLKGSEGIARLIMGSVADALQEGVSGRLGALMLRRQLQRLRARLDPAAHNGAPLLGINGIVIKSHGSADRTAFCRAIELAAVESRRNVIPEIERQLWASY